MAIPIENIYYLLCYAWNTLEEKDRVKVSIDDETTLVDLFAKILINSTRVLIRRGIDKSYVPVTEEFVGIKGKLELTATIKGQLHLRHRTICSFDEFSANILTNRILVSTFVRLLRTKNLDTSLKQDIRSLLPYFGDVTPLPRLTPSAFSNIRLNRNNRFYGFILDACKLIVESLRPSEEAGDYEFKDFTRDENKMNQLFERFVFNFYRIETNFRVRRAEIKWQMTSMNREHMKFLPKMITDITLESPTEKIIIDAKFYSETLTSNYEQLKIRSSHLYQIFSYLMNQRDDKDPRTSNARGILLYPTITEDYDLDFEQGSHAISVKTVNLDNDWKLIDRRLRENVRVFPAH
jgi:5-methylcytosine-specific restriction enzyme subunit McrC